MAKLKSWRELPCGAIIDDPKAVLDNRTGAWRSMRPEWNEANCSQCLVCWVYCPDAAIIVKEGKMTGINYEYCKGCGICANVCPGKKQVKAITMARERK